MDYDYHGGLHRVAESYRETEHTSCRTLMGAADALFEQANLLNFDTDVQLFLKENGVIFTAPIPFSFVPYGDDVVREHVLLRVTVIRMFYCVGGRDQTD